MTQAENILDFQVLFMFPAATSLGCSESDNNASRSNLEQSLASSRPTSLEYWDRQVQSVGGSGVIVGCQDGTIYVLCRPIEVYRSTNHKLNDLSLDSGSNSSLPPFPVLSPTFHVTAKPRVVSGITTVPVEAPRNYVDFEDEPDRLKDILQGKNPKDRRPVIDAPSDKGSKSVSPPVSPSKRKSQTPRSFLSATNSRTPSPPSLSTPNSPQDMTRLNSFPWTLLYHTVTSFNNLGSPVRGLQLLGGNQYFAALHENGSLSVYLTGDGLCVSSVELDGDESNQGQSKLQDSCTWLKLSVLYVGGFTVLAVIGEKRNASSSSTQETEDRTSECATCTLIEFVPALSNIQLRILRQLDIDGPADRMSIHEGNDTIILTSINHGHLLQRELTLRPRSSSLDHNSPYPNSNRSSGSHLAIPNPFKTMMSRSSEQLIPDISRSQREASLNTGLSEARSIGILTYDATLLGLRHCSDVENGVLLGATWTKDNLTLFRYAAQTTNVLLRASITDIENLTWLDHSSYALSFERRVEIYQLKFVDADNEEYSVNLDNFAILAHRPELVSVIHVGAHEVIKFNHHDFMIYTNFSENNQQVLLLSLEDKYPRRSDPIACVLWGSKPRIRSEADVFLTSMLPLDLENVAQGYSDGYLRQFSLEQMSRTIDNSRDLVAPSPIKTSDQSLNGHVLALHVVQNHRTREVFIVGGGDDGSVVFWSYSTFELVARWTIFTTPLVRVVQFEEEKTGPLRGCILCISRDGSTAVIVVDGFHFLYLIPGSIAPLARICLGGNNLLLIYTDHRARLWDAQTKELWRSMGEDKAGDMLAQGGWSELTLSEDACVPKLYWTSFNELPYTQDAVSCLNLNLEKFLINAIALTKAISSSRDEVRNILLTLDRLRLILSALLTPGLNTDVDSICYGKLGAYPSSAVIGLASRGNATLYDTHIPQDVWCVSTAVTTSRVLAIVSVLRAMSLFEELTEGTNIVISFFTSSLGQAVGPRFMPPNLEHLGKLWFAASNELRQSIKFIFEATIANLSDEESIVVAEKWQHHVPSLQPDVEKETLSAALALLLCGYVAAEKYSLMSINALMDISKSISLYLHDEKSIYRVLAIELCSRGFNVWQHYVDAMEILRSLFGLATSVRKDAISIQNVGSQARLAVLNIASDNMPLFMGTLCLDILTPPSMEHRRSVLQILAFLIRKRPYVLQPNLPRLMEAVVKSLDPNSTADRDLVLDAATEIIGHVVKTFPTVDFHMASQRLAVGTNEGAVVMYDLKTAIRLYVLEGHKKAITALSFSPDGRRLVTVSLKESMVLAWKVGSSFASFFNPGAPPRQGNGGSQSFKALNFNIGSEGDMSTAETIDLVSVEWVADRTVKVKIRQSVLTFST